MNCMQSNGDLVSGFTSKIFAHSGLVTEALALHDTISLVVNLGLPCVIFESNCLDLVEMCRRNMIRKEIDSIVKDIQSLKIKFTFVAFT